MIQFIYMVAQCCQLTGEDDAIAITRCYTEVTLLSSNDQMPTATITSKRCIVIQHQLQHIK